MNEERVSILIVEDSPIDIGIIRRQLAKYDYELDFAASGEEAFEKLREKNYDMGASCKMFSFGQGQGRRRF